MGRKSVSGGVREERGKVRLDFRFCGQRLKPVLNLAWNERNRRFALRLMETIRAEIRAGTFDPAAHFPEYRGLARVGATRPTMPTFKDRGEMYLASLSDLTDSTRKSYKDVLNVHWYPSLGAMLLNAIRPADIKEALKNLGPKTRNNALICCRHIFDEAVAEGISDRSPVATVKNAKVQRPVPDPYTLQEVEAILKKIKQLHGEAIADYFEFAFFTGVRASEHIALEWRDYDRAAGTITVERACVLGKTKPTKTHSARHIELLERARCVLERQRARTGTSHSHIFINPVTARPWAGESSQWSAFRSAVIAVGLR